MSGELDPKILGEVLALLAHDLKNPLAAALTNLAFARSQPAMNEDVRDALEDARQACDALQRFVANFETLARDLAERLALPSSGTPLDLANVAEDVSNRAAFHATARRQTITVKAPKTPVYAAADRDLVVRVADNLLLNALQYAPTGSDIEIELARVGAEARLVVRDDGVIVPAALREEAMTMAGQLTAKSQVEARYGRGLGLFVASVAARAARGKLEVGEARGRSALTFTLPVFEDERPSRV